MKIVIIGDPVAQERPRFRVHNIKGIQIVQAYDPPKSKKWKKEVAKQASRQPIVMMEGALFLKIVFYILKPKSVPKKRIFPEVRPDLDNYVKAVKDGLSGVCWNDDSQVVQCLSSKNYTQDTARVEVEILRAMHMDYLLETQLPLYSPAPAALGPVPEDYGFNPVGDIGKEAF